MSNWTSGFESSEAFQRHLKAKFIEMTGAETQTEAMRRMAVYHEWSIQNE